MQVLAKLWSFNGKDFVSASLSTDRGPPDSLDIEGMTKASQAFATLWSSAMEVSQTLTRHAQEGKTQDPLSTELLAKFLDPKAWFSSMDGMDQALQRMGGFAPTQPRTQHDNARGVAAGGWQVCGRSEPKGTNGSAWLLAGIARALGRDRKYCTSRDTAFR